MCSKSRVRSINIHFIQQVVKEQQPQLHASSLIMQYHNGLNALLEFMPDEAGCDTKAIDDYVWVIELLLTGLYGMFDEKLLTEKTVAIELGGCKATHSIKQQGGCDND